jgi:hypothetical protein
VKGREQQMSTFESKAVSSCGIVEISSNSTRKYNSGYCTIQYSTVQSYLKLQFKHKFALSITLSIIYCEMGRVEPEQTSIIRQQLGNQVSAAMDTKATINDLLEIFYIRSVQSGYKEEFCCKLAVQFRGSKGTVSRELGSARKVVRIAL